MAKLRYAIVGTGARASMYAEALTRTYAASSELAAVCDSNGLRAANWLKFAGIDGVPVYAPDKFSEMLERERIDRVIACSVDRTHDDYICVAMRAGRDVITEKPMTTDADKCRAILEARQETGRSLQVTFNYRYAPRNSAVKQALMDGVIGEVQSVHFEWLLDTIHGADYFRRWHRDKANSGGLLVHKATHHFDLVNWWLDTVPEEVVAFGGLRFYGRENAERHGRGVPDANRAGKPGFEDNPFALDLSGDPFMRTAYLDAESQDGYQRDQDVFGDGINIEDDLGVLVRYRSGASLSYHLTAYAPWEGYRVMFNGTEGRLEFEVEETPYVSGRKDDPHFGGSIADRTGEVDQKVTITVRPHWDKPRPLGYSEEGVGGHGGADPRMLADLFDPPAEPDPLGRKADHISGAWSILTGIAGNRSLEEGRVVRIEEFDLPGITK